MIKIEKDRARIEGDVFEICANLVHLGLALLKSDDIKEEILKILDEAEIKAEKKGDEDFLESNAIIKKYIKAVFDNTKILKEIQEEV